MFLDVWLILSVIVLSSFAATTYASCNQNDQESLLTSSLGISAQLPLNWSASFDCCTWEGVGCDGVNYRVTRLSLPSRGLRGHISPSIANLSSLAELDLASNWLSGPLPDRFFASLNSLRRVDLSYNRLSGQLSPSDKLPSTIQKVNLSSNHFDGAVEFSFFQQAAELLSFSISNNSFSGQIPSFICSTSSYVNFVDFSSNDFSGPIPQGFGKCSDLQILRAGFNNLSGHIPSDIYRVSTLQELSLHVNGLIGLIDEGIGNLINLRILSLYSNELTGGIPQNIGILSNLEELLLHINNLNGTLPPSLTNCTRLKTLNLRVNLLEGELSAFNFSKFVVLSTIDLGNNFFHGKLPASLYLCKSLTAIRLATNKLEGEVLPDIMELQSLSFLSVSNNSLTNITTAIRILTGCKNITTLTLSKNFYSEPFPDDKSMIGYNGFQNLQVLGLGGCNLTDQIPKWLANLGRLQDIDLSFNHITGTIPGWFGHLSDLFYLSLANNFLYGYFPIELTEMRRRERANKVDESPFELPLFVQPNNVSNFQYNRLSSLPTAIYLGSNRLRGNILPEIGLMKFVQALDFSSNRFSGSIPDTVSNLTNLETLELSGNDLTGQIPSSLKELHFLSSFDVANNHLQGPIPTGGQFDTFPSSSFQGNPGLCGRVIQRPCSYEAASPQRKSTEKSSPKKGIIIGLSLGIFFGVNLLMASLLAFRLLKWF